jgi:DNA-binding response OmpR family regulator
MRLILVEDDPVLASAVRSLFDQLHTLDIAQDLRSARQLVRIHQYQLAILDLNLPDGNGQTLCQDLHKKDPSLSILILTGTLAGETAASLLECGADDYLRKPFHGHELTARVQALLRRAHPPEPALLSVANLTLNTHNHIAKRDNQTLHLRRKEFLILEYLMQNCGAALTRGMILRHVWDGKGDPFPNTVDVHIKNLRDQVDRPFAYPLIHTVPGIGYTLCDRSQSIHQSSLKRREVVI